MILYAGRSSAVFQMAARNKIHFYLFQVSSASKQCPLPQRIIHIADFILMKIEASSDIKAAHVARDRLENRKP